MIVSSKRSTQDWLLLVGLFCLSGGMDTDADADLR